MTDEPGFGKETHSTYEPLPEEIAARRVTDLAACTPDVDTLVETVRMSIWGYALPPYQKAKERALAALSDLAATARRVPELEAALRTVRDWIREGKGTESDAVEAMDSALAGDGGGHPEDTCARCGGANPVWTAPSPLWNAVMRGGSINGLESFTVVCPSCFAALAEEQGIVASAWRFDAKHVEVELETVTPTGRVWNPETWLWDGGA